MIESGNVVAVHPAEIRHRQPTVLPGQIGMVVDSLLDRRSQPIHQRQLADFRDDQPLTHVRHDFVEQENNRRPVGLRHVEGIDRHFEDVLVIGSGQSQDGVIPVGSPPRLVDISLAAVGRDPGGGAAAHDIDDHARNFGHNGVPQGFLHQ